MTKCHLEPCNSNLTIGQSSERSFRGLCKEKNSKTPRLIWKWVGGSRSHSEFFWGKSYKNSPKPVLIFWSRVFCTLLKVVGCYDLSVLSMSVMGFQKKKFA